MKTTLVMTILTALFLGGCATCGRSGAFDENGLPKEKYYVGGGLSLNYQSDEPGTYYVVENVSEKLLITETLDKGSRYEVDIDPTEEGVHLRLKAMGIDPTNMQLRLYFVPSEPTENVSEE